MTSEKKERKVKICDNKSVGILVFNEDKKLLLIERMKPPYGFAPPAGHVDDKGSFENAAREELKEEVGLEATSLKQIYEGKKNNPCRRQGGDWHEWKVFKADAVGEVDRSLDETKQAGFYTLDEIKVLSERTDEYAKGNIPDAEWEANPGIEPVWNDLFNEVGFLE